MSMKLSTLMHSYSHTCIIVFIDLYHSIIAADAPPLIKEAVTIKATNNTTCNFLPTMEIL